jgi:signal transduction histidine kinase
VESRRSFTTLLVFGACLFIVLGGVAWISLTALDLVEREKKAQMMAALEENVRLALWRMDSSIAPIIGRESARPYFAYQAFYPAERAYTRMFAEVGDGEVLIPSPLLSEEPENILLHFQIAPDGALSSPEAPVGRMRALASEKAVPEERLLDAEQRLGELRALLSQRDLASALIKEAPMINGVAAAPKADQQELLQAKPSAMTQQMAQQAQQAQSDSPVQWAKSSREWTMRSKSVEQVSSYNANAYVPQAVKTQKLQRKGERQLQDDREGPLTPVWVHGALVLARRIRVDGREYLQGCWLDWPHIRDSMLSDVRDLLPNARLEPSGAQGRGDDQRKLASLPVELIPGAVHTEELSSSTPIKLVLGVAWIAVLLAAIAVGVLSFGTVALSERRATFVSAVTHELRTPLTTFRMYSEMLAEGMVTDEAKKQSYMDTLRREAIRLGHLVENVLAYARIERGRATGRIEDLPARETLERIAERLRDRATQAGMSVEVELPAAGLRMRADATAVEQILFNLVDNACKYAGSASDKRIEIAVRARGGRVAIDVKDHGPGIGKDVRRRLFSPFSKSAERAAISAPGIGLGLALSRRLARTMGGDLSLESSSAGASFVVELPVA